MSRPSSETSQSRSAAPASPASRTSREADGPTDLTKASWKYVLRKTAREFGRDECTDLAAALTYYAVLALFPALMAMLSLIGLVGNGPKTADTIISILNQMGAASLTKTVGPTIHSLANASGRASLAFAFGLVVALWSASGYVGSFGRALNRMYDIDEGRPVWKLRPVQLVVTLIAVVLAALVALALVLTGPAAKAVGSAIGLGSVAVTVWEIAKWPVILIVVGGIVAILYYATPNVQQPRFRWISLGAALAIVIWVVASAAFGFYVARFSSYDKTYGTMAGAVVFLLWLWITNLALLFGAELDRELERGRELQAGLPAEETLQLAPRDTRLLRKKDRQRKEEIAHGRELRRSRGAATRLSSDASDERKDASEGG